MKREVAIVPSGANKFGVRVRNIWWFLKFPWRKLADDDYTDRKFGTDRWPYEEAIQRADQAVNHGWIPSADRDDPKAVCPIWQLDEE